MRLTRLLLVAISLATTLVVVFLFWANRYPEIPRIVVASKGDFATEVVHQGESLAGIGACMVCHTAPGGELFAGGLALPTPFGVIYSTNITPDPETGIGAWSQAAFLRAMREGVDRTGRHLFPAFPYDHFARATDEDIEAIYAYLMTREPVSRQQLPNELTFPFNFRILLAGWKLFFHDPGPILPDPEKSEEWNRGAYLAEGLGHCGACHSPRNVFGAVIQASAYDGGEAEEWYVPALNATSTTPLPWTQLALVNYLFDGWDEHHGIAAGPMTPVVNHLYDQSEDDVFAIAAYFESMQRPQLSEAEIANRLEEAMALDWRSNREPPPATAPVDPDISHGMTVFQDQCANCHKSGTPDGPVSLAMTATVNAPDPRNIIHIIFDGIRPPRGAGRRSMPGFGASISDDDIEDLLQFIRWHFTDHPPWDAIPDHIANKRAHW